MHIIQSGHCLNLINQNHCVSNNSANILSGTRCKRKSITCHNCYLRVCAYARRLLTSNNSLSVSLLPFGQWVSRQVIATLHLAQSVLFCAFSSVQFENTDINFLVNITHSLHNYLLWPLEDYLAQRMLNNHLLFMFGKNDVMG